VKTKLHCPRRRLADKSRNRARSQRGCLERSPKSCSTMLRSHPAFRMSRSVPGLKPTGSTWTQSRLWFLVPPLRGLARS
jgi:hypothetical protein